GVFTNELLDTLQRYKAHASFFLIGKNAISYKDVVKRMQNDGHTIGNHSWDHKSLPLLTPAAIDAELSQTNTEITKITGIVPSYMRPPGGALAPNVYAALQRQNMTAVMWSVDTRDWADRNSDIVYNRVVSGAKPGAIIILHDIHKTSVDAVPRILKALQRQGYAFVSIDELFGPNAAPGKAVSHAK
ncbi:MAG TPA: polysaccharide deacetylase family protein, partial [Candidatus Saccharimonas sp.]|nr:polysaccharide deacetylase family protein [Candidatus Saccharimonas sp.]